MAQTRLGTFKVHARRFSIALKSRAREERESRRETRSDGFYRDRRRREQVSALLYGSDQRRSADQRPSARILQIEPMTIETKQDGNFLGYRAGVSNAVAYEKKQ